MTEEKKEILGWHPGLSRRLGLLFGLPCLFAFHAWALVEAQFTVWLWLMFFWQTFAYWAATIVVLLLFLIGVMLTLDWIRWGAVETHALGMRQHEARRRDQAKREAKAEAGQLSKTTTKGGEVSNV